MEKQRLVEFDRPQNVRIVVLGFGSKKKRKIIPPFLFTEKNVTVTFCVRKVKTY